MSKNQTPDIIDIAIPKNVSLPICSIGVLSELNLDHHAVKLLLGQPGTKILATKIMTDWEKTRMDLVSKNSQQLNNIADKNEEIKWFECEKINIEEQMKQPDDPHQIKMFCFEDIDICYVIPLPDIGSNKDCEINPSQRAEQEHSDLIAGKYEGGLKVWECTNDLIKYIVENEDNVMLDGKMVLDLGCGVGILGIYALLNGAFVTFQDYNKEIVTGATLPGVLFNIEDHNDKEEITSRCQFYSGDWESFNKKLPNSENYDLILTSETIYNESNYKKLIDIFLKRLSANGCVLLAAKTYYFGVGGGLRQFETCINETGKLNSEVVWKSTGGIQREIIKITRL